MLVQPENISMGQAARRAARSTSLSRAARFCMILLAAFACARGSVLGGIQAVGAAFFAAGACAGLECLPMLLGCVLGCASLGDMACVWPAFACLSVWLILCVLGNVELNPLPARGISERMRRLCLIARGDTGSAGFATLAACSAACANLIMTLTLAGAGHAGLIYCAVSALLGFGLTPVLALGMRSVTKGGALRERMAVMLLLAACAAGLQGMAWGPLNAGAAVSVGALYMLAQGERRTAPPEYALLGLIAGGWAWLSGASPWNAAAYVASGAALCLRGGAVGGVLCAALCALGALPAGEGLGMHAGAGALARGLSAALGMAVSAAVRSACEPGYCARESTELLRRCEAAERADSDAKAGRLASDLDALMGSELPMTYTRELESLKKRMCGGCDREDVCWRRAAQTSRASFIKLHAELLRDGEAHPELLPRGCVRQESAAMRLAGAAQSARQDERRRMLAARRIELLNAHCARMRDEASAAASSRETLRVDERLSLRAYRTLRECGLNCVRVCVTTGDARRAYVELAKGGEERRIPERAERALMRATGVDFEFMGGGDVLRLRQRSRLCVRGAIRRCAQSGEVCGDSALLTRLSDGRWLAALSDGMGRGEAAARESCAAIAAMNRLLDDGVQPESAIDIVNAMLQLGDRDEMYATLDIALVDPESGRADLYKLSAAPSVLLSAEKAHLISASAPPFGILEDVSAAHRSVRLRPGDRLMLLTDGVCDFSDERQSRAILNLTSALAECPPESAAERIITRMRARFEIEDDAAAVIMDISARHGRARKSLFSRRGK